MPGEAPPSGDCPVGHDSQVSIGADAEKAVDHLCRWPDVSPDVRNK